MENEWGMNKQAGYLVSGREDLVGTREWPLLAYSDGQEPGSKKNEKALPNSRKEMRQECEKLALELEEKIAWPWK